MAQAAGGTCGAADLANAPEDLTRAGRDPRLLQQGIPAPVLDDGSAGDWRRARRTRPGRPTDEAIARAFSANPNPQAIPRWSADDAIRLHGLPASPPVRSGPVVVQRFQRAALQRWGDAVPGMPAPGTVVGILGGDLACCVPQWRRHIDSGGATSKARAPLDRSTSDPA